MKHLVWILCFLSSLSFADEKPLSKAVIQSILTASKEISKLEPEYPTLFSKLSKLDYSSNADGDKAKSYIKASAANERFTTILNQNNITDITEFYSLTRRFSGGLSRYQLANSGEPPHENGQMVKFLENKIAELKAAGAADEMLAAFESQLKTMQASQKQSEAMVDAANDQDLAFIKKNITWIQATLKDSEN